MRKNQYGISAFEGLLVVVIIGLVVTVGWMVMNRNKAAAPAQQASTQANAQTAGTLKIKEWGVQLAVDGVTDPTYKITAGTDTLAPRAYLSTKAIDTSTVCIDYYKNSDPPYFQWLERYSPEDKVAVGEADVAETSMAASEAAKQANSGYITVGSYVYRYNHLNGLPCDEGGSTAANAYGEASMKLKAAE